MFAQRLSVRLCEQWGSAATLSLAKRLNSRRTALSLIVEGAVFRLRIVREGELAVNGQAAQRRRADMEYASQDEVRILALRHQREIRFLP